MKKFLNGHFWQFVFAAIYGVAVIMLWNTWIVLLIDYILMCNIAMIVEATIEQFIEVSFGMGHSFQWLLVMTAVVAFFYIYKYLLLIVRKIMYPVKKICKALTEKEKNNIVTLYKVVFVILYICLIILNGAGTIYNISSTVYNIIVDAIISLLIYYTYKNVILGCELQATQSPTGGDGGAQPKNTRRVEQAKILLPKGKEYKIGGTQIVRVEDIYDYEDGGLRVACTVRSKGSYEEHKASAKFEDFVARFVPEEEFDAFIAKMRGEKKEEGTTTQDDGEIKSTNKKK